MAKRQQLTMSVLHLPLHGGCQCGRHRYVITVRPLTLYACHCTDCQTQSGSAFGMSMPVPRAGIDADVAALKVWRRQAASGRTVAARCCGDCGTRLFHEPVRNPDIINVKPGTLDDTSWLRPVGHLWLDSAQPWFRLADDALAYPGQPASFEALFARFNAVFGEDTTGTKR